MYYNGFVNYANQGKNEFKTAILFTVFLALVIGAGYVFSRVFGDVRILYGVVAFSFAMNFASYWYSDRLVIKLAGAVPADPREYSELHDIIHRVAGMAGLPVPKIFVIKDPAPNAFATGRNEKHASLAFTTGLLQTLKKEELEGVVAHELSHVGNRDILIGTVLVALVGLISIASDFFLRFVFMKHDDRGGDSGSGLMFTIGIALSIFAPIIGTIIRLAISRGRETLADASGAGITHNPNGLADALGKISAYVGEVKNARNITAHLYISNPFGPKKRGGMIRLFLTHPPIEERIQALREMARIG